MGSGKPDFPIKDDNCLTNMANFSTTKPNAITPMLVCSDPCKKCPFICHVNTAITLFYRFNIFHDLSHMANLHDIEWFH